MLSKPPLLLLSLLGCFAGEDRCSVQVSSLIGYSLCEQILCFQAKPPNCQLMFLPETRGATYPLPKCLFLKAVNLAVAGDMIVSEGEI
jgi:hypothetical protein